MAGAFATLHESNKSSGETVYTITFSRACESLFKEAERCYCTRTEDCRHIVIQPIDRHWIEKLSSQRQITKSVTGVSIAVTKWVKEGYFSRYRFDGTRYKVKRGKNGKVYICLDEPIKKSSHAAVVE